MKSDLHKLYIGLSILSAGMAAFGVILEEPVLYATLPGIIGAAMAGVACWKFVRHNEDLVGFIATMIGFVYYQAFQGNPVTQPEFVAVMETIPIQDRVLGITLSNLTTAFLLVVFRLAASALRDRLKKLTANPERFSRDMIDGKVVLGFWVVFAFVALPNVLFGKVIMGAINSILYQRMTWADAENYSGFSVWGGPLGASAANLALWAPSLLFIWLYLLGSKYRVAMFVVGPLVVLWTAGVVLQGSRTYLATVAIALVVYLFGIPEFGKRAVKHVFWVLPLMFLLVQISTHFRGSGLQSVNIPELAARLFEVRGNEGASSQIDGIEFFRTELVEKDTAVNPIVGLARGLIERPIEGVLMPVPRTLFPLKPVDHLGKEFNLFYQNVRLGVPSGESFLGASPGLFGRELIKYGIFGPLTLAFWFGILLAVAGKLSDASLGTAFYRICAALIIAFVVAQARDFAPVWFIPFLPAAVVFGWVFRTAKKCRSNEHVNRVAAHNMAS